MLSQYISWSVTISLSDGTHPAFDYDNGLGLHDLQPFGAHSTYPAQPLSTLRTPRYRDARKTRFRPCPLRLWSAGTLTRAPFVSFSQRTVMCCCWLGVLLMSNYAKLGWGLISTSIFAGVVATFWPFVSRLRVQSPLVLALGESH